MGKDKSIPVNEPSQEDIEEKVRQMLDPSLPDKPTSEPNPEALPAEEPAVSGVSAPIVASAPELPADKLPKAEPKKRSIAVAHKDEEAIPTAPELTTEDEPIAPVKKITIADHNESASDLADKLDKTIAELDDAPEEKEKPAELEKDETLVEEVKDEPVAEPLPDLPDEEIKVEDPAVINDPDTEKAVAEIVAAEGDEILEVEDAIRDTDEPAEAEEEAPKPKQKGRLKKWLKKPLVRNSLIILAILLVIGAVLFPTSRYAALNTVGVRATSSLVVLDESSGQPLKNVQVSLGSVHAVTDAEGKVKLGHVRLGANTLIIEKRAFAPITKNIVVGWGSNPLGELKLHPTGTQFIFRATDFLSNKPLSKLEASSNDATAVSDDKGVIKLTIDKPGDQPFVVTIKGDGLRTENITLDPNDRAEHAVKFVPVRKHLFISKRSGKYDIYSAYIDGQDEKVVLAGNGQERDGMALVQHPSDSVAAYVSTRGNQHNSDGFLLSNLLIVDTDTGDTTNVAVSERIQLIDWSGDYLVYVQIAAGASGNSPSRYKLVSYNYKTDVSKDLASSNYFNDVVAVDHVIYYAPSSAYQTGKTAFYKINADGSGQQTIFDQEVWNIFRTSYDHLVLSVQQQWYDYRVGDKTPTKLNAAPADQTPRVYANSQDGSHSARIENRDGKGTLLVYDTQTRSETTLTAQSGLGYPVYWLSNKVLVYRVKTAGETADYVISIDGGDPVKIRDVTASLGLDKWYYY